MTPSRLVSLVGLVAILWTPAAFAGQVERGCRFACYEYLHVEQIGYDRYHVCRSGRCINFSDPCFRRSKPSFDGWTRDVPDPSVYGLY